MHTWEIFFYDMSKRIYNKSPLSFIDQIILLKRRGLTVSETPKALSYLQEITYYRLSAYFLPYQNVKDSFNVGVNFNQIIDTYTIDLELRLRIFDCIERIEIAIPSQFHPSIRFPFIKTLEISGQSTVREFVIFVETTVA